MMPAVTIKNRLRVVGLTHIGRARDLNEDNLLVDQEIGLLIVADGMGGHDAGEVASQKVIDSIQSQLIDPQYLVPINPYTLDEEEEEYDEDDPPTLDNISNPIIDVIKRSLNLANAEIFEINQERGYANRAGMGSTVVGLWMSSMTDSLILFHVGDSRCYRFFDKKLTQVTQDHSMYQQWLNFGRVGDPPARNVLAQAIGPSKNIVPDISFINNLRSGERILLCSDGLNRMVPDRQICKIISNNPRKTLTESAQELVEAANSNGGKDNITVILIEVV